MIYSAMRGWCEMSVGYARSYTTLKLLNDDHLTTTTKQKFTTFDLQTKSQED